MHPGEHSNYLFTTVSALSGRRLSRIGQKAPLLCSFKKLLRCMRLLRSAPGKWRRGPPGPPEGSFENDGGSRVGFSPKLGTTRVSVPGRRLSTHTRDDFAVTKGDKRHENTDWMSPIFEGQRPARLIYSHRSQNGGSSWGVQPGLKGAPGNFPWR